MKRIPLLKQPRIRWMIWLLVVVIAAAGLQNYRIDNDISRWMPDIAGDANLAGMLIVGYDPAVDDGQVLAQQIQEAAPVKTIVPVAGDGRLSGLLLFPNDHATGDEIIASVRGLRDDLPLAGPRVFSQAIDDWSQRGLPLASGLILLCGAAAVYLATRRVKATAQSLVAIFSSQFVLMGLLSWCNQPVDMMLSMLPPLMMAMGFSYAAHRAMRPDASLAMLLSMATSAAGLLTFAFTDFVSIRSFALWGAAAIGLVWLAVIWLVQPLDAVASPPAWPHDTGARPLRKWRASRAWLVTLSGLALTFAGLGLAMHLKVESDVLRYFPSSSRIVKDYTLLNDELTGMLPFEVQLDSDAALTHDQWDEALAMLRNTQGVRHVMAVSDITDEHHRHVLGMADQAALTSLSAAQADWQTWAKAHGVTLQWQGVAAQLDRIGRSVIHTATTAVPAMIVIAGLAAWLIDRRLRSVLLGVYVNIFPAACLVLAIWFTGHAIGLATLVIFSLVIGMAIDDTLHLLVAAREDGSLEAAVHRCFTPCLGSSIAVGLCMAMFIFCAFKPTAEFGLLVAMATMFASAGDLILLPAAGNLMARWSRSAQVDAINHGP